MKSRTLLLAATVIFGFVIAPQAEVNVTTERNQRDKATAQFKFENIPSPLKGDAARQAKFTIVAGEQDSNGGDVAKLHDGKLPSEDDQPSENFFFNANTEGGRLLLDLSSAIEIKQVNTYSWHAGPRGPQVYKLFGSDGSSADFNAQPKKDTDPKTCGWKLVANIDTRPERSPIGGQYGVSISDSDGAIGKYRYLLFDISRTEQSDPFGNTFYSEIDVIDRNAPQIAEKTEEPPTIRKSYENGKYHFTIDTSAAADLTEFTDQKLAPVVQEWYPKIVDLLPSDGFTAATNVTITFKERMSVPAATGGNKISCNAAWFRNELKREAIGSVVHELVHVVQAYGYGRIRGNPNATRTPNWIVEGIPDYIRWFLYEPQTHGADITKRNLSRAKYDASYRVTGNFLNWVTEKFDRQIVAKLNAAAREGKYSTNLWTSYTGKAVEELGAEWKKSHEVRLAALADPPAKATTADGQGADGWKSLFNGKDLTGWHNFRTNTVKPGWQVKEGSLACIDPHNAGDLCTDDQFDWFELQLDYNISEGGNSGIMFHVTDEGRSAWATGPEFQLEDNAKAADPQRCGWLYALYQPPTDEKIGKPLDATKPAGEWNHVRLLISPEKCEHEINGVKYFEYVLGSDDFKERVAKSKFGKMPLFAKSNKGYITLQGDHGQVSFRNIKIRVVKGR